MPEITAATSVASGFRASCATSRGQTWCFGLDNTGLLGDGQGEFGGVYDPVQVLNVTGALGVAMEYDSVCAATESGAWCWGDNTFGQLGDGTTTDRDEPVEVQGL